MDIGDIKGDVWCHGAYIPLLFLFDIGTCLHSPSIWHVGHAIILFIFNMWVMHAHCETAPLPQCLMGDLQAS